MRDFILNWKGCYCEYSNIVRPMIADSMVDSQTFHLNEWFFSHQENHPYSRKWNWEANLFRKQEIRVFDDGRLVQYSSVLQTVQSSINIAPLYIYFNLFNNNERSNCIYRDLRAQSAKFSLFLSSILSPLEVSRLSGTLTLLLATASSRIISTNL